MLKNPWGFGFYLACFYSSHKVDSQYYFGSQLAMKEFHLFLFFKSVLQLDREKTVGESDGCLSEAEITIFT